MEQEQALLAKEKELNGKLDIVADLERDSQLKYSDLKKKQSEIRRIRAMQGNEEQVRKNLSLLDGELRKKQKVIAQINALEDVGATPSEPEAEETTQEDQD